MTSSKRIERRFPIPSWQNDSIAVIIMTTVFLPDHILLVNVSHHDDTSSSAKISIGDESHEVVLIASSARNKY